MIVWQALDAPPWTRRWPCRPTDLCQDWRASSLLLEFNSWAGLTAVQCSVWARRVNTRDSRADPLHLLVSGRDLSWPRHGKDPGNVNAIQLLSSASACGYKYALQYYLYLSYVLYRWNSTVDLPSHEVSPYSRLLELVRCARGWWQYVKGKWVSTLNFQAWAHRQPTGS